MSLVIQLGNAEPQEFVNGDSVPLAGPAITEMRIDPNMVDDKLHPAYTVGTEAVDVMRHIALNPGPVKHMGGNELVQEVLGQWALHGAAVPTFVNIADPGPYDPDEMEDFERFLSEYWDCPRGAPDDLEATYFTEHSVGAGRQLFAPGEAPEPEPEEE